MTTRRYASRYRCSPPCTPSGEVARPDTEDGGEGTSPPRLIPAQDILPLPFAEPPPLFLEELPETVRPFKETIPRLSGKEGAKDVPDWAHGDCPYVGENGRDFAKRLMDRKYGPGEWKPKDREYRQIKR